MDSNAGPLAASDPTLARAEARVIAVDRRDAPMMARLWRFLA